MSEHNISSYDKDEETFLSSYNIEDYDRPSVTADIVAFKINSRTGDTYRHNSKSNLSILLVRRGEHPYKNYWALPGGFLRRDETIEECAYREVREETGAVPASLMPVGIFSNPNRDPRGRIISNAYLSIISDSSFQPKGGTDATDASWFDVYFEKMDNNKFSLVLSNEDTELVAWLQDVKTIFRKTEFCIESSDNIAFDHAEIIGTAITLLRNSCKDYGMMFDFVPKTFTLTELQGVQEAIMNENMTAANFRRKISEYVEETEEYTAGFGHRPAKLFKRKE